MVIKTWAQPERQIGGSTFNIDVGGKGGKGNDPIQLLGRAAEPEVVWHRDSEGCRVCIFCGTPTTGLKIQDCRL